MADIKSWSGTASQNIDPAPDGFPEHMAPSGVNDAAREVMAAVRRQWNDAEWFNYGNGDKSPSYSFVSSTVVKVVGGAGAIAEYHAGRRVRYVGAVTIYGTVQSSATNAADLDVTVTWDSGSAINESFTLFLHVLRADNPGLPQNVTYKAGIDTTGVANNVITDAAISAKDGTAALPGYSFELDADTGHWRPDANTWAVSTGGTERLRVTDNGIFFGDTANANNTAGLTLHQGVANNEIFSLKSTTVAHGATDVTETETYGFARKGEGAFGGLRLEGIGNGSVGMEVFGYALTANIDGTKTVTSGGVNQYIARGISGVGVANLPANGNAHVFKARVGGVDRTVAILDEDGDLHVDGSGTIATFDAYDDPALLSGLRGALMPPGIAAKQGLVQFIDDARPVLERNGIVTFNEDGGHFLSLKGGLFLTIDGVRQVGGRVMDLEAEVDDLRARLDRLEGK